MPQFHCRTRPHAPPRALPRLSRRFRTSSVGASRDHEIRLAKAIADALRVLQRGSVAPRRTMRSDYNVNLK